MHWRRNVGSDTSSHASIFRVSNRRGFASRRDDDGRGFGLAGNDIGMAYGRSGDDRYWHLDYRNNTLGTLIDRLVEQQQEHGRNC